MSFGIILVKEVHANEITDCEKHNRRLYTPEQMPRNVKVDKIKDNVNWIEDDKPTFRKAIYDKLEGIKVRKNAVLALEIIASASPDFFKSKYYSASGYLSACETFISNRYGRENLVATNQHFDEATPHVHMLVIPLVEKTVRWKNGSGEGERKERRLCARDLTGDRLKLRQLQDDFHEFIVPIGKVAGIEFKRGIPVEEQTRIYTERTDHRMTEIRQIEERARQEIDLAQKVILYNQLLKETEVFKKDKEMKAKIEKDAKQKSQNIERGFHMGM